MQRVSRREPQQPDITELASAVMVQQREQAAFVAVSVEAKPVVEELDTIVAAAAVVYYYMALGTTAAKEQTVVVHNLRTVVGSILRDHLDKEEPGILAWRSGPKMDSFHHTDQASLTFSATCTTALQLLSP